jgi:hypothetical protein
MITADAVNAALRVISEVTRSPVMTRTCAAQRLLCLTCPPSALFRRQSGRSDAAQFAHGGDVGGPMSTMSGRT